MFFSSSKEERAGMYREKDMEGWDSGFVDRLYGAGRMRSGWESEKENAILARVSMCNVPVIWPWYVDKSGERGSGKW